MIEYIIILIVAVLAIIGTIAVICKFQTVPAIIVTLIVDVIIAIMLCYSLISITWEVM